MNDVVHKDKVKTDAGKALKCPVFCEAPPHAAQVQKQGLYQNT